MKKKWWFPNFDSTEWLMVVVMICGFTFLIMIFNNAAKIDEECRNAGGVPVQGACIKKESFINTIAD